MKAIVDFLIRVGQKLCDHPGVVGRVYYRRGWRLRFGSVCSYCGLEMVEVPVR